MVELSHQFEKAKLITNAVLEYAGQHLGEDEKPFVDLLTGKLKSNPINPNFNKKQINLICDALDSYVKDPLKANDTDIQAYTLSRNKFFGKAGQPIQ